MIQPIKKQNPHCKKNETLTYCRKTATTCGTWCSDYIDLQPPAKPKVVKYCTGCDVGVGCSRAGMNCVEQPKPAEPQLTLETLREACSKMPEAEPAEMPLDELRSNIKSAIHIHTEKCVGFSSICNTCNPLTAFIMEIVEAWHNEKVKQQCAECSGTDKYPSIEEAKAAIAKAAVSEFASSLLKYTHDHNCVSDLDVALDELVAIKRVGKLKEGGEQHPNSESCYDAIEALKAFITHLRSMKEGM